MNRVFGLAAWRLAVLTGLCVALLALGVSGAFAASVTDTKLLDFEFNNSPALDIEGINIVYADTRGTPSNTDVYLYDTGAGMERRITINAAKQASPAIDSSKIVYTDDRSGKALYVYDLMLSSESLLVTGECYSPAIDNGVVVYIEKSGTDWAVRRIAIGGAATTLATYSAASGLVPQHPVIDGSRVAWEVRDSTYDGDDEEPRTDVVLLNGATLKTLEKCYAPKLASGKLAYTSRSTRASYVYTISSKSTKKMADNSITLALSKTSFVGYDRTSDVVFLKNLTSYGRATLVSGLSEDWAFGGHGATDGTTFAYATIDATGSDLREAVVSGNVVGVRTSGAAYKGRATIKGMVSSVSGKAVTGKVRLYRSSNGTTWTRVATHNTTKKGAFTFKSNIVKKPTYYRVRYLGTSKKPAATSESLHVKPRVLLSRPSIASRVSISKDHTVTGRVTPRISDVAKVKLVFQFKPKGGSWHVAAIDDPTVSWTSHSGYWTYKARFVRFDNKGAWRVRAERMATDSWAQSTSSWRYFTVK